jgi:hypothetical protein
MGPAEKSRGGCHELIEYEIGQLESLLSLTHLNNNQIDDDASMP